MKKQELIHLHALALETRDFVSERERVPPDAFDEYDQNGVTPGSVQYNKTAHKESLQLLLDGILVLISTIPAKSATEAPLPGDT